MQTAKRVGIYKRKNPHITLNTCNCTTAFTTRAESKKKKNTYRLSILVIVYCYIIVICLFFSRFGIYFYVTIVFFPPTFSPMHCVRSEEELYCELQSTLKEIYNNIRIYNNLILLKQPEQWVSVLYFFFFFFHFIRVRFSAVLLVPRLRNRKSKRRIVFKKI